MTTKKYYVSLVGDLIGCYVQFEADCEEAVRLYLAHTYRHNTEKGTTVWGLPWCAVYDEVPECEQGGALIIRARCGVLYKEEFVQ